MSTRSTPIRTQLHAQRATHRTASVVASRKNGFTVLEVLVAMFILLVGGLAILNIFPPALRVIRGSENREIAISMTQSMLERYANEPKTIPDAVYNDDGAGVWSEALTTTSLPSQPIAVAGTRIRNKSLPSATTDFADSALDKFKRIVGERQQVLDAPMAYAPTIAQGRFVLSNFSARLPIAGQPNTFPKFYIEENIIGVKTNELGELDFENARLESDATQTLSDTPPFNNQLRAFWRNPDFLYYVSYRYLNGTQVNSVEEEKIAMPTATPRVFQGRIPPSPARQIVKGEIAMRVRLPLVGALPTPAQERAAIGYLPLPGGLAAQDALGRTVNGGDIVSVDYTVSDWRNLIVNSNADTPTSKLGFPTARDVKLPVPTLNSNVGVPLYGLLLSQTNEPRSVIGNWSAMPLAPVVDVSTSSATFDIGALVNPKVRVSYATSRDWAQQVSVAAKSYYRYDAIRPGEEREQWREYWSLGNTLYFHASEAGKTVLVTFRNGTETVSNQVVPIDRDLQTAPTDPLFAGFLTAPATRVAAATITSKTGGLLIPDAILSVRGASIRSRTAWIESNNYVQEIKEDYRPLTD